MRVDARRLAVAVGLFLLLAGGSVLAAGVVDSASLVAGPLPSSFRMAEARVGDSGTFVWDRVRIEPDGNVSVLNEHEIIGFEWLAPESASDAEGVRHEALKLHQWGWQPTTYGADLATIPPDGWERYAEPVYAIDLATDRILSYAYLSEATANPASAGNTGHSVQRMFLGPDDRFWPACGPDSPWSGREVPLDQSVDLFRACMGFSNALFIDAHKPVRAAGTQMLGERETILFSSKAGDLHVWYDPDIPVPIRVAARSCSPGILPFAAACRNDEFDILRLNAFRRGTTPLPERSEGAAVTGPAAAWEFEPLRDGLPDESGTEHAFPASAALAAARGDPNGATFRDVLDAGYVSFLDYSESASSDVQVRAWDISAYDGERKVAVRVEQRAERAAAPTPAGPLPGVPPITSTGPPTWSTTTSVQPTEDRSGNPSPHPRDAPRDAPTVASMWARWSAFASDEYADAAPNTWGMRILCVQTSRGGCSVLVERWAGVASSTSTQEGSTMLRSVLRESDNELRGHEMDLSEYTHASSAGGAQVSVQARTASGELTLIHSRVWVTPASPVVVRSALAAALVSLAYLLFPTLRTAAVLLYTRNSTPPDILKNPERSRMMDIVRERPGLHVPELARAMGRGRSPTEHHLAMLRRVGLVRVAREGARRRVYACDARVDPTTEPVALASEVARGILELRRARPDAGPREVARTLGVSPGTVSYHMGRLRASGLLAEP